MDSFTQRMLEKAEQRSRTLGITNASKIPLAEYISDAKYDANTNAGVILASQQQRQAASTSQLHQMQRSTTVATNTGPSNKLQVVEKITKDSAISAIDSPNKVLRQFTTVDKENVNFGIDINIVTDKNVEVNVEVEEQDITDEDDAAPIPRSRDEQQPPMAAIRDTSRNRLQRLGALYSNTTDLSSPIHRTEAQFHAGTIDKRDGSPKKPKQRYGKLVALANTINQWEDDTSHHNPPQVNKPGAQPVPNVSQAPPKPDLPSRHAPGGMSKKAPAPQPPTASSATKDTEQNGNKTKQLKWDPKVINSLEAQGFQRRESSTVKFAYDYNREDAQTEEPTNSRRDEQNPSCNNDKPKVGKLPASTFTANTGDDKKTTDKKAPGIRSGLVSGRAAVFENKANNASQQAQRPQKDPTELTLKERMQLFEKNKGDAILPKAAFGMAPSISQIRQDAASRKEDTKGSASSLNSATTASVQTVVAKTDNNVMVRDKVAAFVSQASTISENKIKADIQRQRQEDMQVLANRFNKQKEIFSTEQPQQQGRKGGNMAIRPPPPPPPPMPTTTGQNALNAKRRSPGDTIDEESKRAKRTDGNRLYPALSDLESNGSYSDNDRGATTATASGGDDDARTVNIAKRRSRGAAAVSAIQNHDDDDEENDSYEAEDSSVGICDVSLGREIMQVVVQKSEHHNNQHKNEQTTKRIKEVRYADQDYYYEGASGGVDSSMNSSEGSMGVDDFLDEALADGDDDFTQESDDDEENGTNTNRNARMSKGTTSSNSFSFRKTSGKYVNCQTIAEEEHNDCQTPLTHAPNKKGKGAISSTTAFVPHPVTSELSVNQEDENMVTLVHTVSFYRRQQNANSANSTPVRKICREQQVSRSAVGGGDAASAALNFVPHEEHRDSFSSLDGEESDADKDDLDDSYLVQEKIKKLLDEVCKQQQVIAQTSQALNLCAATVEFSGSTESVEGERHLLVATHRRQACLDEVQRLRVEKSLRPLGAPKEKGRLTVKDIMVPLRQDYIRKLSADTISGHHLVCLLKYNEHVLSTKTVPTLPGLLAVKFPDVLQLNNAYADFRITLEIYGMTAQREVLPHEVKYHINLNKKSGIKTPKKKAADNRLVMPPVQSPAGPHVVRTPALVQYGFAIFSLREIQRTTWTLTQMLGVSPLDGVVHMKVNCELSVSVEYKGFLTMFEDISGFGAWHRRWCHLNGAMLNYWKYPDDEKKKTPMGSFDLYTCSSQKVTTAPRDICARLNTLLLECQRPSRDTDQESLIIVPNGRTTIVRHLLSADTKEERDEWCAYFNKALTLLRAWGPPQ